MEENKGKIVEFPEELQSKKETELTDYQKCLRDHQGQCGVCHQDGTFTPCAK